MDSWTNVTGDSMMANTCIVVSTLVQLFELNLFAKQFDNAISACIFVPSIGSTDWRPDIVHAWWYFPEFVQFGPNWANSSPCRRHWLRPDLWLVLVSISGGNVIFMIYWLILTWFQVWPGPRTGQRRAFRGKHERSRSAVQQGRSERVLPENADKFNRASTSGSFAWYESWLHSIMASLGAKRRSGIWVHIRQLSKQGDDYI